MSPATARRATPQTGAQTLRVTYRKSAIGYERDQKATITALGLKRLHQTVEHTDTPALRGMVFKVRHLVSVDGIPADSAAGVALLAARPPGAGAAAATAQES
jgi:large subunit ribosomal protein L30